MHIFGWIIQPLSEKLLLAVDGSYHRNTELRKWVNLEGSALKINLYHNPSFKTFGRECGKNTLNEQR